MNEKKRIARLRKRVERLRGKGGIKPTELESLAMACGRVRQKRGSEPTWINLNLKQLRPLSIPHHKELNRFTAQGILDQLEIDLDVWEGFISQSSKGREDE